MCCSAAAMADSLSKTGVEHETYSLVEAPTHSSRLFPSLAWDACTASDHPGNASLDPPRLTFLARLFACSLHILHHLEAFISLLMSSLNYHVLCFRASDCGGCGARSKNPEHLQHLLRSLPPFSLVFCILSRQLVTCASLPEHASELGHPFKPQVCLSQKIEIS